MVEHLHALFGKGTLDLDECKAIFKYESQQLIIMTLMSRGFEMYLSQAAAMAHNAPRAMQQFSNQQGQQPLLPTANPQLSMVLTWAVMPGGNVVLENDTPGTVKVLYTKN